MTGESSFTVIGAGRSGAGVSRMLASKGRRVLLYDDSSEDSLKFLDRKTLENAGVRVILGEFSNDIFDCDTIVKSPGVPPENALINEAKQRGIRIISEIEAAFEYCPCPVIAVTGTNGKTTTTVLTGEIFKDAGRDVRVCGNVGVAFSDIVDELTKSSLVILEASSYQLNDIDKFRPLIGVMMNITPDHLDWHGSFENYLSAKMRIAENMNDECLLIINYDDKILFDASIKISTPKAYFSLNEIRDERVERGAFTRNGELIYFDKTRSTEESLMETKDINIRGNHNLYNSLAAAICARALGVEREVIAGTLSRFAGVGHRIEFVRELAGVKYFNDSKATNIESLVVALQAFEGNLILIMGGREKGNDYSKVEQLIKNKARRVIAIGETQEKIAKHFNGIVEVVMADSMKAAVRIAKEISRAGDTVLLSPACKSFDMFESFEHRGEVFKELVNELK